MPPAGSSVAPPAPSEELHIEEYKRRVYEAAKPVVESEPNFVFHQNDFIDMDIIPGGESTEGLMTLQKVLTGLVDDKLLKLVQDAVELGWRLRTEEDARKYLNLTDEQELVYSHIDEAANEGLWTKTIKTRCNLNDAVFNSCLKVLESKKYITNMKSVEFPTRKMFIKFSLRPSLKATGGSWYTDGELDTEMITQLMHVLEQRIQSRSFYRSSIRRQAKKTAKRMTPQEIKDAKAARDTALGGVKIKQENIIPELTEADEMEARRIRLGALLPMPAGYAGYPTLTELTGWLETQQVSSATLAESDVQQLLDLLEFDDKVEKIKVAGRAEGEAWAYKSVRKSVREEVAGGKVSWKGEVPCGRCPVFELCEEGGPVGPSEAWGYCSIGDFDA